MTAQVIAIDGPSGSGKGTLAGLLAARLGWQLLDSGALYRLLAYAAGKHGIALDNEAALAMLREFALRLKHSNTALEEWSNLWTRLTVMMYFLDQPETDAAKHVWDLSKLTGQEPSEIESLIQGLAVSGILSVKNGRIAGIDRGKMWSMFSSGAMKEDS